MRTRFLFSGLFATALLAIALAIFFIPFLHSRGWHLLHGDYANWNGTVIYVPQGWFVSESHPDSLRISAAHLTLVGVRTIKGELNLVWLNRSTDYDYWLKSEHKAFGNLSMSPPVTLRNGSICVTHSLPMSGEGVECTMFNGKVLAWYVGSHTATQKALDIIGAMR